MNYIQWPLLIELTNQEQEIQTYPCIPCKNTWSKEYNYKSSKTLFHFSRIPLAPWPFPTFKFKIFWKKSEFPRKIILKIHRCKRWSNCKLDPVRTSGSVLIFWKERGTLKNLNHQFINLEHLFYVCLKYSAFFPPLLIIFVLFTIYSCSLPSAYPKHYLFKIHEKRTLPLIKMVMPTLDFNSI